MPKFERVNDRWKEMRQDLFGNVELEVKLEAITIPIQLLENGSYVSLAAHVVRDERIRIDFKQIERLPAISAGVSYGSKEVLESDTERAFRLNKSLIDKGHDTPLEAVQLNFHIKGLSKTAGAQLSRYRTGNGHVSASRRFRTATGHFVYPVLDYIEHELIAGRHYKAMEDENRRAMVAYEFLRSENGLPAESGASPQEIEIYQKYWKPLKKEDARQIIPVDYATERTWWVNVRALRYIFKQRLRADTEAELRRLCWVIHDMVCALLPSLFEDLVDAPQQ